MSLTEYDRKLRTLYDFLYERRKEDSISDLAYERNYLKPEQLEFLTKVGVFETSASYEIVPELEKHNLLALAKELSLVNDGDYYILASRYIVPVYNINNHLVSLIGWARESHDTKYITLPSPYLKKKLDWFGFPYALKNYTNYLVVVEGVFDALTLNAIGIPTVSTMGSDVAYAKNLVLQPFKRILVFPDNDRIGKQGLYKWNFINAKTTTIDLRGTLRLGKDTAPIRIKDGDDLGSFADSRELRELFQSIADSTRLNVLLDLTSDRELVLD